MHASLIHRPARRRCAPGTAAHGGLGVSGLCWCSCGSCRLRRGVESPLRRDQPSLTFLSEPVDLAGDVEGRGCGAAAGPALPRRTLVAQQFPPLVEAFVGSEHDVARSVACWCQGEASWGGFPVIAPDAEFVHSRQGKLACRRRKTTVLYLDDVPPSPPEGQGA